MLNKILKIFFFFSLAIISTEIIAKEYSTTNPMTINTYPIDVPKGEDYPKYIYSFEKEDYNLVNIKGPGGGGANYPTTAYIKVNNPVPSKDISKEDNAVIFKLEGSPYYGYSIEINPIYRDSKSGQNSASFPGSYIKSNTNSYKWIYAKDQNNNEPFNANDIGARIKIKIYALEKPPAGIETINKQVIAIFHYSANRGQYGTDYGNVNIDIGSFTINPSSNTCKITPSDTHVINMKPVNIKDFPSIGSEVDGGGETTITLTCSEGATNVKVGMTDITERNNTSNQLKLDPKSTALGFAVTLYRDNGDIITYNPDPKIGNNTWELSPSTSSSNSVNYNVPIKAKYYRTGSIISPGIILANAAITFIYE